MKVLIVNIIFLGDEMYEEERCLGIFKNSRDVLSKIGAYVLGELDGQLDENEGHVLVSGKGTWERKEIGGKLVYNIMIGDTRYEFNIYDTEHE